MRITVKHKSTEVTIDEGDFKNNSSIANEYSLIKILIECIALNIKYLNQCDEKK